MANDKFDFDDFDDFEDFSMFDEGDGEGGFKSTTKTGKAREAVGILTGGFVSGVKRSLFSRNFYQSVVGAAMPSEYSTALDKGLQVKDNIEELYDTAHRESSQINDKLTKGVKPIVDKYGDKLPKRMKRPLREWTRNVRTTSEWTSENKDELESVAALNDIFNKREQTRSIKDAGVEAQVQTGIAKSSMNLTAQLLNAQHQQIAYQDQVDATWKRKSLELQYKQFFVQRKLLDVQQQSLGLHKEVLPNIMHNTALPDLVKARSKEVGGRMLTEKLYGSAMNHFSGLPYDVLRNITGNITNKMRSGSRDIQQDLSEALDSFVDNAESASDMADLGGQRASTRAAGQMAGEMGGGYLGGLIAKRFRDKLGSNERVRTGADILSSGMRRLPRIFNGMIKDGDSGSEFVDMLVELTGAQEMMHTSTGTVMRRHDDELDQQIYFDLLTKKSITEIIPGYLTRIHHEIKSLRTGDTSHPLLEFDFEKGLFSDKEVLTKRLKSRTIGRAQQQALGGIHDELSEALGLRREDGGLNNKEIERELLKQFSLASLNNTDFTFSTMLGDRSNLTDEQQDELKDFMESEFDIDITQVSEDDSFINRIKGGLRNEKGVTSKSAKAQRAIMDAMDKMQSYISNPTGRLNAQAQQGKLSNALSLGILDDNNGTYVLNKERFIEALMSGDIDLDDDSPDFEPPTPDDPEPTATKIFTDSVKQKATSRAKAIVEDTKKSTSGIRESIKNRDRTKPFRDFYNGFTSGKYDKLKARFSEDDKFNEAMAIVKRKFGTDNPTLTDIRATYLASAEFREIFKELQRIDEELGLVDKPRPTSKTSSATNKDKQSDKKIMESFSNKSSSSDDGAPVADDEDYREAEEQADAYIEENNIPDEDGVVKDNLIKDFFEKRFGTAKTYLNYMQFSKRAGAAKRRAKKGIDIARSKGGTGATTSGVTGALSILFELSKFTAKAAEIGTRPGRAALKLLPWGLKKIVSKVIDAVNFRHIEHGLWLEGEKEPRLLKNGLMTGRYVNGDGEVIEKPKDITGDVFDTMSNPPKLVMSKGEYKGGLFDSTGKLIHKPPTVAGRVASSLVKLPFKVMKGAAKLAGKFTLGYLKVTTKPVTWLINKILQEKRIEPKLHAELAQLGLTDQTNRKIDEMTKLMDERLPKNEDSKYNDKDGDGSRDGSKSDVLSERAKQKQKEKEEKAKRKGIRERLFGKKKKGEDDEDEDGSSLMDILGKGKMFGRLAGLAKNPYVLGGAAIASMIGWEGLTDAGKNKDPEDVANLLLPDAMKDNKAARIGARLSEKLVNMVIAPVKGQAKGVVKTVEYASRLGKWINRKDTKLRDATKSLLSKIPGATAKFLFGRKAGKALDKLMNVDNINPLFRFRMAQYGFKHTDSQGVEAILKLEDDILKDLIVATETTPARISDAVTIEQSASYFGVTVNDEDDLTEWIAWFANRFRPVFLSNVTVMQRMGYDSRQLHNVDSMLGKQDKLDFIKKVDFNRGNFNPYDKSINPMDTEWELDVVGQGNLDDIKEDSIAEIEDMPDDPVKVKDQQNRTAKRENKLADRAKARHKDTVAAKRFDPYAAIDSVNFKSMFGLKSNGKSINDVVGDDEKSAKEEPGAQEVARQARIDKHGAVGEMLSSIGGLFVKSAHASNFRPEVAFNGSTAVPKKVSGTFKANKMDGASSIGPADKPISAVRALRDTARDSSNGDATKHIKAALTSAGYKFTSPARAADYPAKALPDMGFEQIPKDTPWMVGDIMVFSTNKKYRTGHIQMFDGANWISDHIQDSWLPMEGDVPTYTLWRDTKFTTNGKFATNKGSTTTAKDKLNDATAKKTEVEEKDNPKSLVQKALEKIGALGKVGNNFLDDMKSSVVNSSMGKMFSSGYNKVRDKVSNVVAKMTGSQKEWQMSVYNAFKSAGFSEQQARILTAEIGRENSYNPKYMFAGHADPHSGSNLGMLSWQGDRLPRLVKFLKNAGVLDKSNNIIPGQAALDAQARFIMWEMKNTHKSVGAIFLSKPNIEYSEGAYLIGKRYILWRIDDPKYKAAGIKNRDGFYNMLLRQLAGGGAVAQAAKSANESLTRFAAPIVNPLNKFADKVANAITGGGDSNEAKDAVTDNTTANKVEGNAKPAVAARYCRKNAAPRSRGQCAKYVRIGLQHAKYSFTPQRSAYMYHTNGTLSGMGFVQISGSAARQVGDIIVLNRGQGKLHGHIAIWDGSNWVSDFVQNRWTPYSTVKLSWSIWRDKDYLNGASRSTGWTPGTVAPNATTTNTVLKAAGGTFDGGGSNSASVPYNPVTMKYNNYEGVDDKIRESYAKGTKVELEPTAKEVDATTDKEAVEKDKKVKEAAKQAVVANKKAESKTQEVAKAVAQAVESKASTKPTSSEPVEVSSSNELREEKMQKAVAKSLTEKMSETQSRRNSEEIAASNRVLRESLKVQKQMLGKLTGIEKHMVNVLKGQANRVVTESGGVGASNVPKDPRPNRQQENKVRRPGRDEPMSMSKML